jgi:peptidoglycan/xylan/chitin deacetylase (PgdA/CDA1 family)
VVGALLGPIRESLDAAPRPVDIFFRDDDVGWEDGRLWELLDIFEEHGVPVDLAVIPTELDAALAGRLGHRTESSPHGVGLHQHGFAHINHEAAGRKYEFGSSRTRRLQRRDLLEGRGRLRDLLGPEVDPIFTPPWNRCTRTTGLCLAELGYEVLSREGRATPLGIPGLVELPVSVDWFANRKGVRLTGAEWGAMVAGRIRSGGPVGFMFHHALMDADERAAAGALLSLITQHPRASPSRMRPLARVSPDTASV